MATETTRLPGSGGPAAKPLPTRRIRPLDALFHAAVLAAVLIAVGVLVWLITSVLVRGVGSLDLGFLLDGPSQRPERAGFNSALRGSLVLMLITAAVALPLGAAAAVYLEKFANTTRGELENAARLRARNLRESVERGEISGLRLALARVGVALGRLWVRIGPRTNRIIEVNISNLAAVPSIIYGLLGLALFIAFVGLNKSLLAGGLTLGLLVLPIMIIASREAVRAVPISIEQGAMALGATKWQAVARQVLPAALPGMLTGSILAMSRAIGEAAPLIVVGGIAFGTATPSVNPLNANDEPLFAMPLQIFTWATEVQSEFRDNLSAAGIIVLLAVLLLMNSVAIILRNRYSRRW
jgi:phosphate transport system permease protein